MELSIQIERPDRASELFGPGDRNLRTIRDAFGVQLFARNGLIKITGPGKKVSKAVEVINNLQREIRRNKHISDASVANAIGAVAVADKSTAGSAIDVYVGGQLIKPKTAGQEKYIKSVLENDMVFCSGPAGTGKTYLAVAIAVHMLKHHMAKRLVLVRPAVEAGEKLGFLPGDMQAKVNPYLRPLFDALHDMMDYDQIRRFMVNDLIEVIPLAFMRGRTLNDSFIILDEAQNSTPAQMKMFLTRMGHGSKMVITGDASQTDLDDGSPSGLVDAMNKLGGLKGLDIIKLERQDIVRHNLVQRIVQAYDTPHRQ